MGQIFNNLQWAKYSKCLSSFKDNPALTFAKLNCSVIAKYLFFSFSAPQQDQ